MSCKCSPGEGEQLSGLSSNAYAHLAGQMGVCGVKAVLARIVLNLLGFSAQAY